MLLVKDRLIVAVLGEDYISCTNIVSLLIPGILAQSVTLILVGDLLGSRNLRPVLTSGLLCFVVMTTLDLVLIPRGGFLAAALASAIAYAAQAAHLLSHHCTRHRLEALSYLIVRPADVHALRRNVSRSFGGAQP
jgi:O-antigen/teichoic acid export membrane protein